MGSAHSASDGNEKRKFRSSLSIPSLIDKFHSNTRNGNPVVSQFAFSSDFSFTNPSFRKRCFDVRIWFAPIATSRLDLSAGANLYRFRPTSRLPRKVHTGTGYVLGGGNTRAIEALRVVTCLSRIPVAHRRQRGRMYHFDNLAQGRGY